MRRKKLLKYLTDFGCYLEREGSSHSVFRNPATRLKTTVPRHTEIQNTLAEKICKDLGLPKIRRGK